MFWSFVFFFVVIYLLGFSTICVVLGRCRFRMETHVITTGIGLAIFAVVGVVLNTVGVPLTWWTFLLA